MTSGHNENDDRPKTPPEEYCCGNSCNPCIFDVHKKLLEEWERKKLNKLKISPNKNYLSPIQYSKFIIKDILEASKDFIFIHLDIGSENKDDVLYLSPSQHVMIRFDSVSRPYTPISWNLTNMKLLIKLYPDGKASTCIKNLKIEDEFLIRGPYGEFKYNQNSYKNIVMFSIGSGIAAVYPLAVSIVKDELEDTKIKMISGFRSLLHVPLKKELRLLTDYWNFECTLCLSQMNDESITGVEIVNSRLNEEIIDNILNDYSSKSTLVLICGTPEFNNFVQNIVIEKQFPHYHVFR